MSKERENCENAIIDVHVFGVPGGNVMLCYLHKDKQVLDQLVQTTKMNRRSDGSLVPFLYMHKGVIIDQSEKSTAGCLKFESKDQILAIASSMHNCLLSIDIEDLDRLHVKVFVIDNEMKIHLVSTQLSKAFTIKYLKQQFEQCMNKGRTKDKKDLSVVHNGLILEDEYTFYGAGVCEGDTVALIDLGRNKNDSQLEKLIILNSINSRSLLDFHNKVNVGIPGGVRVLHNLDPGNLEGKGHSNKKSASACKSLLRSIKFELIKELDDFFLKIRHRELSINFDELMVLRMEGSDPYVHATDLLSDISETLLMVKIKCKIEKSLWKEIVCKVFSLVQGTDLSRISCARDYEPFKNCAVSLTENFPLYSDLSVDSNCSAAFLQETVLFIGPKRDGKLRPNLPLIKLRAFTSQTTIQDLINSYKVYTNLSSLQIDCLSFNNKLVEPTELITQVLGGMFEKNYLGFSVCDQEERLDSLVEFIEGKKEKKIQKQTKKKKLKPITHFENPGLCLYKDPAVKKPNCQESEVPPSVQLELEQTLKVNGTENAYSEAESDDLDKLKNALKNKEILRSENNLNLQQMIEVKSREMKILLVNISGIEDDNCLKDKRTNSIDAEINDLEDRIAKLKKEKLVIDDEKDVARKNLMKLNDKKVKLENYIGLEMMKAKARELDLETEIDGINGELTALIKCDSSELGENIEMMNHDPRQKLLDFLTISISEKEKDLECPVCLETASAPIYSCQENHLICSSCRPMVKLCPECRMEYGGKKVLRRHRYAEKTVVELERLREEKRRIME